MILAAVLKAMEHFYQDNFTVEEDTGCQQWTFSVAKRKGLI